MMMLLRRVAMKVQPLSRTKIFYSGSSNDLSHAIAEANQEMEYVLGKPPVSSLKDSLNMDEETDLHVSSHLVTNVVKPAAPMISKLTHVGSGGEAQMVNIASKEITNRVATASCKVILGQELFDLVSTNQMGKGDVLSVARIAGIYGAKQTSNLIPLCHNINLSHVHLNLRMNPDDLSVEIEGEAACSGKTGVEMEALTAVTVAGLTVYDMCKAASKDIVITDVKLQSKRGGKSGDWHRN